MKQKMQVRGQYRGFEGCPSGLLSIGSLNILFKIAAKQYSDDWLEGGGGRTLFWR